MKCPSGTGVIAFLSLQPSFIYIMSKDRQDTEVLFGNVQAMVAISQHGIEKTTNGRQLHAVAVYDALKTVLDVAVRSSEFLVKTVRGLCREERGVWISWDWLFCNHNEQLILLSDGGDEGCIIKAPLNEAPVCHSSASFLCFPALRT